MVEFKGSKENPCQLHEEFVAFRLSMQDHDNRKFELTAEAAKTARENVGGEWEMSLPVDVYFLGPWEGVIVQNRQYMGGH